jgi:hypothetical protein
MTERLTHVRFVQTGGFGGLKLVADIDPATLDPSDAASLERLVDEALAEEPSGSPDANVRDDQQYEITVTRGGTTERLQAADPIVPPGLAALIARLQKWADPVR